MLIPPISLGLLATFKDHITKPTAMAQGRVAHLIEWKSWGGEAASRGGWCGGWGGVGAALQEDEQLYSHLTDEIKEARFAAGETAFIYLTCSYQVSNTPLTLSIKLQPYIKVYTAIPRLCYLMLLTSSALRKMKDRGRIFPFFLSTLTALILCLLVTCWHQNYSNQCRNTGYWLHFLNQQIRFHHLQNDSVISNALSLSWWLWYSKHC